MSTITRERLRECAHEKIKALEYAVKHHVFAETRAELEEELALARIALAWLDAKPMGYISPEQARLLQERGYSSISADQLVDSNIPIFYSSSEANGEK